MSKILAIDPRTNKLIGELNNRGNKLFYDDEHVHELEGEHSFSFSMSSKIKQARLFTNRGRFLVPSEEGGFHEFIILQPQTIDNEKNVVGTAAYTEMDTAYIVPPGKYSGTLQELATHLLQFTKYSLGVFQDIRIRSITVEEHIGAYEYLKKLATLFEMELRFRVETSGPRIAGRFVDFVQSVGFDNGKEVVYGEDLVSVEMTEYADRITTRLLGFGPEKEDGTRLTSEAIDEDAFQRWNDQGQHITRIYTPETSDQNMTQARLDQLTQTELKKRIDAVVEYVITAASVETAYPNQKVRLGDKLFIKNPTFEPPLYADARVIGIKRSIIDKKAKVYTIGEVITYTEDEIFATFRQLQKIYGVKLVEADIAPPGAPKTIWINTNKNGGNVPFNTPYTFNMETLEWDKFAPTSAAEIGGLVVGRQYNGVAITPEEGLVVTRTDELVRTTVSATDGISIENRKSKTGAFQKALYAGTDGTLTLKGITIEREDGYKVVDNGIMAFDYNIQGVEPPFLAFNMDIVKRGLGQWYVTETAGSADVNQYRFKHQGRYLKVFYRVLSSPGNTSYFEIWRGGQVVASAFSSQTEEYAPGVLEGYMLTVDLGPPTGLPSTFQIRLRSAVAGLKSYGQIMGKWLEG